MMTRHPLTLLVATTLCVAACGPAEPGGTTGAAGSGGPQGTGGTGQAGASGGSSGGATGGASSAGASGGSSPAGAGGAGGTGGTAAPTGGRGGDAGGPGVGGSGGRGGDAGGATGGSAGGAGGAGGTSTGGRGGGAAGAGGSAGRGGAGAGGAGGSGTGGRGGGGGGSGTCTASRAVNSNVSGSGPHRVVVETNADPGINEGTIFRPMDLGGAQKYPIFVWGEGGCSRNGLSNSAAMAEIASHGYFVVADGTPNSTAANRPMNTSDIVGMGKPLLAYVTWAIAENDKACSAYYQSLETTKVGSNGFSCGGLMAEGTAGDPRITTWGINSSGMFSANQAFYRTVHTPVLIVLGGPSDNAYPNGKRDYDNISALGFPIMLFSRDIGHGGDLFSSRGGDFTKINLAWLNWHLKGDQGATGKGVLVGSGCSYCTNSAWEVMSRNVQ